MEVGFLAGWLVVTLSSPLLPIEGSFGGGVFVFGGRSRRGKESRASLGPTLIAVAPCICSGSTTLP